MESGGKKINETIMKPEAEPVKKYDNVVNNPSYLNYDTIKECLPSLTFRNLKHSTNDASRLTIHLSNDEAENIGSPTREEIY